MTAGSSEHRGNVIGARMILFPWALYATFYKFTNIETIRVILISAL